MKPLVAITGEEIRIQRGEIQWELTDAVGTIDTGKHLVLLAKICDLLEWHTCRWKRTNGVEDGDPWILSLAPELINFLLKSTTDGLI